MKFAVFDADGFPLAFYDEEIHGENIPAEAVQIAELEWREFIDNQGYRRMVDGKVEPYEPPPAVPPFPSVVSAAQAKIALFNAGLLDQVKAIVTAHPYEIVRLWYENAGVWERGNAYVQALGAELDLDDAAIDALFIAASKV